MQTPGTRVATWRALGTEVRLAVTGGRPVLAAARRLLQADLAALDAAASRFRPDSELIALESRAGAPQRISPLLADLIAVALQAARDSGGDLDPALGAIMVALGYDRDFGLLPDDGPPVGQRFARTANWRDIHLDGRVLTLPPGLRLDLGATAKARAADLSAARIAAELGCPTLVGLGGDIAVAGEVGGQGWPIRVQDVTGDPAAPPVGPAATVAITGGGLATSSITGRQWRRGGRPLHHILDPRSGLPVRGVWRTVSVTAGSALAANVASTTAIIRSAGAVNCLASAGLPARLVALDGSVHTVGGWPEQPAEPG